MGIDLTLLPFDHDGEQCDSTMAYSHTVLNVAHDSDLFDMIRHLPKTLVAEATPDFTAYVSSVPDGSMEGESCYGTVTQDAYDAPLNYVRAGALVKLAVAGPPQKRETRNSAVWAYLAALPPETKVVLYWC